MGIIEADAVRMIALLPSSGADPIPVRLAAEAAGGGMIEADRIRMIGVLPSEGADPIPVSGLLYPSPLSISPAAFTPIFDTYDWYITQHTVKNRAGLVIQYYAAPVNLPHGVTVTKVTLYGYRDDNLSTMALTLYQTDRETNRPSMAGIIADWIDGYGSKYDDTINLAVIDNENYSYGFLLILTPNDAVEDCYFTGAKIEFTA